jgi:hypothetical protein
LKDFNPISRKMFFIFPLAKQNSTQRPERNIYFFVVVNEQQYHILLQAFE